MNNTKKLPSELGLNMVETFIYLDYGMVGVETYREGRAKESQPIAGESCKPFNKNIAITYLSGDTKAA